MKALALLTAAAVTLFSVAASAQTYGTRTVRAKLRRRRRLLPKARRALGGTGHRAGSLFFLGMMRGTLCSES